MIVSLPPKRLCIMHLACNAEEPPKKPNTDHQTDRQSSEKNTRETPTRTPTRKKKKQGGAGTLVKEKMKMNGSRS